MNRTDPASEVEKDNKAIIGMDVSHLVDLRVIVGVPRFPSLEHLVPQGK